MKIKDIQSNLYIEGRVKDIRHMLDILRARKNGKFYYSKNRVIPLRGKRDQARQLSAWGDSGVEFLANLKAEVNGEEYSLRANQYKNVFNTVRRKHTDNVRVKLTSIDMVDISLENLVETLGKMFKDVTFKYMIESYGRVLYLESSDKLIKYETSNSNVGGAYIKDLIGNEDFIDLIRDKLQELDCFGLEEDQQEEVIDTLEYCRTLGFISPQLLIDLENMLTSYDEELILELYESIIDNEYGDDTVFNLAIESLVRKEVMNKC